MPAIRPRMIDGGVVGRIAHPFDGDAGAVLLDGDLTIDRCGFFPLNRPLTKRMRAAALRTWNSPGHATTIVSGTAQIASRLLPEANDGLHASQ